MISDKCKPTELERSGAGSGLDRARGHDRARGQVLHCNIFWTCLGARGIYVLPHRLYRVELRLSLFPICVLQNEHVVLHHQGTPLVLAGVADLQLQHLDER